MHPSICTKMYSICILYIYIIHASVQPTVRSWQNLFSVLYWLTCGRPLFCQSWFNICIFRCHLAAWHVNIRTVYLLSMHFCFYVCRWCLCCLLFFYYIYVGMYTYVHMHASMDIYRHIYIYNRERERERDSGIMLVHILYCNCTNVRFQSSFVSRACMWAL